MTKPKTKTKNFRISEEDFKKIEEKAGAFGWDVSEYIRFCCLNTRIRVVSGRTPEEDLLSALKFIEQTGRLQNLNCSERLLIERKEEEFRKYIKRVDKTEGN